MRGGLEYLNGKFKKILPAGSHYYTTIFSIIVKKVDIRMKFITVPGQEVLSSDGVTLKVSLAAQYEIKDLNIAINKHCFVNFRAIFA